MIQGKIFYNISEVSEMFDIPKSTIRFWEKEISILNPSRSNGVRKYTQSDIKDFRSVYYLVKEKGLKISAVNKCLQGKKLDDVDTDARITEKLQGIRSSLTQVLMFLDDADNSNFEEIIVKVE